SRPAAVAGGSGRGRRAPGRQPADGKSPARTATAQRARHRWRALGAGSERRALRPDTALQDVNLVLEAPDLARFLGARERVAVDAERVGGVPRGAKIGRASGRG